jgi:hypothetical protein
MPDPDLSTRSPAMDLLRRAFLAALAVVALAYALDFFWYHLRLSFLSLGSASSSMHRTRIIAIPGKNNKVEYEIDSLRPEEDVPCSRTLFPHSGHAPCWYLARHLNDPIQM